MDKYIEAGKIINTHGVRGEVKIQPWTNDAEFLKQFDCLYIDEVPHKLLSKKIHKQCLIALFQGVEDINDAMLLKNKTVFFDRTQAKLAPGEYFYRDILGAAVVDENGVKLGELADIMELPAGNVYVVKGEREILIPAVPEFILSTDAKAGLITVHLIDGM